MKPTFERVSQGVALWAEMMPWFPKSLVAKAYISQKVHEFVGTDEQLNWFIDAVMEQFNTWEGLPALRALFNSRYAPADGLRPAVDAPGPTAEQLEADFRLREMEENERRMESYRQEALAAGEELKAFPLPDVKRLN